MTEKLTVKCKKCRKTAKNCRCFSYYIRKLSTELWGVFVDNCATEPTRGEEVGTWQTRKNSKVYLRPQFIDAYGPILYIFNSDLVKEVQEEIDNEAFFLMDFQGREGFRVRSFERSHFRRLPFLRKPRARRS